MDSTEKKTYIVDIQSNLDKYIKEAEEARKRLDEMTVANLKVQGSEKSTSEERERSNASLRNAQKEYNNAKKSVDLATQANKAQSGSYEQLYKSWQMAQTQLKLMGNSLVQNADGTYKLTAAYIKQSQVVDNAKKGLDAFGKGIHDNRLNVGNYSEAIKGALGGMQQMPGALGQAAGGVTRLGTAFKALLANPIVLVITLIVGAIASLIKAFKSTDKGATEFAARFEQIKAIIDVVRQRLILVTDAIQNVFKGNWREAGQNMKDAFTGIGSQMKEAAAAGLEYQRALDRLKDAENNYISRSAEIKRQIEKLEYTAQDRGKSTEERQKALQEAIKLSESQVIQEKTFAKQRLEIEASYLAGKNNLRKEDILAFIQMTDAQQANASKELQAVRDNNEEKFAELEGFYAKWIEIDTRFYTENKRNISRLSGFDEEIKKAFEELKDTDLKYMEATAKMVNAEVNKLLKLKEIKKQGLIQDEEYYENQERLIENSVKLSEWEAEQYARSQDAKLQAASSIFSSLSSLLGEQTIASKAFAVAAATIDTYAGASKALADPTVPSTVARIAMMAAVIIRGLANVKQILAVKVGGSSMPSSAPSSISMSVPAVRAYAPAAGGSLLTSTPLSQSQLNALPNQNLLTAQDIANAIANLPAPIVSVEDINARIAAKNKVEVRSII